MSTDITDPLGDTHPLHPDCHPPIVTMRDIQREFANSVEVSDPAWLTMGVTQPRTLASLPDIVPATRTMDLRAAWDSLTPELQAQAGMAAIAIGASVLVMMIEEHEMPSWQHAANARVTNFYDAADEECSKLLGIIVEANVLGGDINRLAPPSLASLDIRQCVGCGCTDKVGCSQGCSWTGPLVCSACTDLG